MRLRAITSFALIAGKFKDLRFCHGGTQLPTLELMKSQLEFYVKLLSKVLVDSSPYCKELHVQRDISYLRKRVENEGLSFMTKVMPSFGKHILLSIERGAYTPFPGLKTGKRGLLPLFLEGWTRHIFLNSGAVVPDMDPYYLSEILQICMLFYKLELENQNGSEQTISRFIQNENELQDSSEEVPLDRSILALARELIARLLVGFNPYDIKPKHGPGSVATGEKGNGKYFFRRKYQRLHQKFPYYRYFSPSLSRVAFESGWYGRLVPMVNPIAKVVLVPKDSRGPRLISMEPLEIQWIQGGIERALTKHIERSSFNAGRIRFTDQSPNQIAAITSSVTKEYATVDLSDASDRVSLALFRSLFPSDIVDAFEACRSVATQLPDGRIIALKKFAPMGSSLCFPVLSMTVWSLSCAALRSIGLDDSGVKVFGDDLVIPTTGLRVVERVLSAAGLVVNKDKTYCNSHFRESCGMDAYNGIQVTPIRVKSPVQLGHLDASTLKSYIDLSESFFNKGYWRTCSFIRSFLSDVYGKIPWTSDHSFVGYYCPSESVCSERNSSFKTRVNSDLQKVETLLPVVAPVKETSKLPPQGRLLKGLLGLYSHSGEDFRVARRRGSVIRYRWCGS